MILEWLNQHNINAVLVSGTIAILVVASFIILMLTRLFRQWLAYLQGRLYLSHETTLIVNRVIVVVLWGSRPQLFLTLGALASAAFGLFWSALSQSLAWAFSLPGRYSAILPQISSLLFGDHFNLGRPSKYFRKI
jgi:hypothetical protein